MKNYIQSYDDFVNEAFIGPFIFNDSMSDEELLAMYWGAVDGYSNWQRGFHYPKSDYKRAYDEIGKILKKRKVNTDVRESVNETEQIKIGTFVRYKKDKDFTGGKIISIKGNTAEIHNWDGSTTHLPIKDLEYVKSWNEGINEGAVKAFEMDFTDMLNSIKRGIGWIDPEYVEETWENSSNTIAFDLVKDEIYNRLIKAGVLYTSEDGETKGKKITNISQIK